MFQPSYGIFADLAELQERVTQILRDRRAFSWDIETGYHGESREKASLHPEENFIAGLSLTNSLKWSRYAVLCHDTGPNLDQRAAAEILYPLLVEARDGEGMPLGICHGGKFELRVTRRWFQEQLGITLDYQKFRLFSDSMLESYAEAVNRFHGLKELTELQVEADLSGFWHKQLELEELFPEKLTHQQKKCIRFNVLDPLDPRVQQYACDDTIYTLAHHRIRYPRLRSALAADPNSGPGFIWRLEMAVLPVVCGMEDEGVWYDWAGMREWAVAARDFAARYMDEIREDFGRLRGSPLSPDFNFGSSQQLGRLLYEDCGMPIRHWTKGGKSGVKRPGTDAKIALKGLSGEYPEVAKYLNWKRLTKLYRDFLEAFESKYCFAQDGRAHPSLIQHGVPAGRFACADPNVQQSPKKYHYELRDGSVFDFNFREMIGAPSGWYMLGFDLAQAELRAIAGMAGEPRLLEAFNAGVDVHKVTASLIFGIPVDAVTPEHRDVGKTMGFAMVYGLTEAGLADRLGITRQEAEDLFAAFHAAYPKIKEWTEATIRQAEDTGYVQTWWGRRVRVWGIDSVNRRVREDARLTAGNAPVQGCLPADTRVLTRRGWVPIGEHECDEEVWTGAEWARAVRLPKGSAPRLRVHLSDGRTFDCDDRHKLLVTDMGPWPEWCPVLDVKGHVLARDEAQDWGEPDEKSVEDWYWIGRFTGDGCLWSSNGRVQWKMAFHRTKEAAHIKRFLAWLDGKSWKSAHSPKGYHQNGRAEGWSVVGRTAVAAQWWLSVGGFKPGRGGVQEVPPEVFCLDRERREAFLQGRADADGYRRGFRADHGRELRQCSKIGTVSLTAAQDLCRVASTLGMTGRVCGPYDMHHRGAEGHAHQIYELYFHEKPAPLVVTEVEDLGTIEEMFTLSVHHPRHAFSSEGLISKNSATGDYMKLAMVRADAALGKAGLRDRVRLVMNVHDALEWLVREDTPPAQVIRALQPAVIFPVQGWPSMEAEWHCGRRWGSVRKLDVTLSGDGSVTRVSLAQDKSVPESGLDLSEEDEEDVVPAEARPVLAGLTARLPAEARALPLEPAEGEGGTRSAGAVIPGAARASCEHLPSRVVIVTVQRPLLQEDIAELVAYVRSRPGPNVVRLRLADGQEVAMAGTSGIALADGPELSVLLGGAMVSYDEASVDLAALSEGVLEA